MTTRPNPRPRNHRSGSPRPNAIARAAAAALLVCGLAASAVGCTTGSPSRPAPSESPAALEAGSLSDSDVTVSELTVPGWATADEVADATPEQPNRTGSHEIPVREYEPKGEPWAVLVWAHGGSFVAGDLDGAEPDWVARQFAARGIRVYTVDYVLASDTVKAPAPANDVAAVLGWAGEQSTLPLAVGGASAGGQLAASAALLRNEAAAGGASIASGHPGRGRAQALLLEYPTMHRVQREDPEVTAKMGKLPESTRETPDQVANMYGYYLAGLSDEAVTAQRLVVGELPAELLRILPPTVIVNAEADDLRPSGEEFEEQLRDAGVRVTATTQAGTTHGYLGDPEGSAAAQTAANETMDTLTEGLRSAVGGG